MLILAGNIACQPPESNPNNPAEPSYDVFGVGLLMYQMLSGQHLFDKPSPSLRFKVAQEIFTCYRWKNFSNIFPVKKTGLGAYTLASIMYDSNVKEPVKHIVNSALDPNCSTRANLNDLILLLTSCLAQKM